MRSAPAAWVIGRFASVYPGVPLVSEAYPTSDRYIPATLFFLLLGAMDGVETAGQLRQANAVTHGYATARAGNDQHVKSLTQKLHKRGFPFRWRYIGPPEGAPGAAGTPPIPAPAPIAVAIAPPEGFTPGALPFPAPAAPNAAEVA